MNRWIPLESNPEVWQTALCTSIHKLTSQHKCALGFQRGRVYTNENLEPLFLFHVSGSTQAALCNPRHNFQTSMGWILRQVSTYRHSRVKAGAEQQVEAASRDGSTAGKCCDSSLPHYRRKEEESRRIGSDQSHRGASAHGPRCNLYQTNSRLFDLY